MMNKYWAYVLLCLYLLLVGFFLHIPKLMAVFYTSIVAFIVFFFVFFLSKDNHSKFYSILSFVPTLTFIIIGYAGLYAKFGIISNSQSEIDRYDYIYFSIVTFTTLGYGDFSPSHASKFIAASEALVGYITMGIFIGLIFAFFNKDST
ncbi:potassium channel family protein [uncultured Desulfuromusa sp.]|uniref:potassium channel family protein n=1 Tax=uncultured Desulfuromusa sp. TaxID=219183 RepID=UPI002AA7710D|nr:potassium channel family protein [uncultured Desulfuromusa sp.]